VRRTFSALPYPVSASAMTGTRTAWVISWTLDHLAHAEQAEVGQAGAAGDGAAARVDRLKPGVLSQAGGETVVCSDGDDDVPLADPSAQEGGGGLGVAHGPVNPA